jgi:flavodoxin
MKHYAKAFIVLGILLIAVPSFAASDTLIIFYSRSGYCETAANILKGALNADVQEIKEVGKDRSGDWGWYTAAWDAFWGNHTPIAPEKIDTAAYKNLIICSPIWSWQLAMPLHTFFEKNKITDKRIVLVTIGNIDIKKYKDVGPQDNVVKRFFKDYLGGKKIKAHDEIQATMEHNQFVLHKHFWIQSQKDDPSAKKKVTVIKEKLEIAGEVTQAIPNIKKALNVE